MMFSSLADRLSGVKVQVTVEQDTIFLAPPIDKTVPTTDPELRGTVVVQLSAPKALKQVRVVFAGMQELRDVNLKLVETAVPMQKELTLDLESEVFDRGSHAFNWSFIIPSESDSYQRSKYGQLWHYVKATAELATGTVVTSTPAHLWLVPCPAHELAHGPDAYNLSFEHDDDVLGPVRYGVSSPHLAVASLLRLQVQFLAPRRAVSIAKIALNVIQTCRIRYSDGHIVEMPTETLPTTLVATDCIENSSTGFIVKPDGKAAPEPMPLVNLGPGVEYSYARTRRAPCDDLMRPSTLPGGNHQIEFDHYMEIRVYYHLPGDPTTRHLSIRRPCTVASCCAVGATSFLPAYTECDPTTVTKPHIAECTCGMSPRELYDRDKEVLQRPVELFEPITSERLLGSERQRQRAKTPGYSFIQANML